MNAEKENYLYETYPSLYRQHTLSMEQTCMCWGFECGDGWFDIINNLSQKLVEIAPTVKAVQVKEKFGGLRFYIGPVDTDKSGLVYNLIDNAENDSFKTCEYCGTKENVTTEGGWIKTLCKTCRKN